MRVNEAKLRAYLDDELLEAERAAVEAHLAESSRAQAALAQLRRDRDLVDRAMDRLSPPAGTFSPAWFGLKRLRSGPFLSGQTAPARPDPLPDEASWAAWESPGLLDEIKTIFSRLRSKGRQPVTPFSFTKRFSLVVTLVLALFVVAVALVLPVGFISLPGRSLAPEPQPDVLVQASATPTALPADAPLPPDARPISAVFGDQIELVGYKLLPATPTSTGDSLALTLYWRVLQPPEPDLALFIHLFDGDGNLLVQQDTPFKRILTDGQTGDRVITDPHHITIPDQLPASDIAVGLYNSNTGGRLNASIDGKQMPNGAVYLAPEFEAAPSAVITTNLMVALQPISQGAEITSGMVGLREWPANNLPPGAIRNEEEVIGKVARMPLVQGQVMVPEMLLDPAETVNYELKNVRQLTPCENKGRRRLFIRVQNGQGQGLNDVPVKILWQAAPEESVVLNTESIEDEPGRLEFEMRPGVYRVEVAQGISHVATVNTAHFEAEEPCNGEPGNAPHRGSYEIVFEQVEPVPVGRAADPGYGYGFQVDPRDEALLQGHQQRTPAIEPEVVHCPPIPRPPDSLVEFSSPALGFALTYPQDWPHQETGEVVIFSPSTGGLDPANLVDLALWAGKAPDNVPATTGELLEATQASLSTVAEAMSAGPLEIGEETWLSRMIRFNQPNLCGQAVATIAATVKDGQGYYLVAVAPAETWNDAQPIFEEMLDSFRFWP